MKIGVQDILDYYQLANRKKQELKCMHANCTVYDLGNKSGGTDFEFNDHTCSSHCNGHVYFSDDSLTSSVVH